MWQSTCGAKWSETADLLSARFRRPRAHPRACDVDGLHISSRRSNRSMSEGEKRCVSMLLTLEVLCLMGVISGSEKVTANRRAAEPTLKRRSHRDSGLIHQRVGREWDKRRGSAFCGTQDDRRLRHRSYTILHCTVQYCTV